MQSSTVEFDSSSFCFSSNDLYFGFIFHSTPDPLKRKRRGKQKENKTKGRGRRGAKGETVILYNT